MNGFESKDDNALLESDLVKLRKLIEGNSCSECSDELKELTKSVVDRVLSTLPDMKVLTDGERAMMLDIVETSPLVEFFWDVRQGWKVVKVTENVKNLIGYPSSDFYEGKVKFVDVVHPEDRERVSGEVRQYSHEKRNTFDQEYRLVRADGKVIDVFDRTLVKYDDKGKIKYYYGYVMDITDRKELQLQMAESLETDFGTGLPNKLKCLRLLEETKHDGMLAVRLGGLSDMNSLYGHLEVNDILEKYISYLTARARAIFGVDEIFRVADSIFTVILPYGTKKEQVYEFVKNNTLTRLRHGNFDVSIRNSFGYAEKKPDQFDTAMSSLYLGRKVGKFTPYTEKSQEEHKKELERINGVMIMVKDALLEDRIVTAFQGIRNNGTKCIDKYEALVRIRLQDGTIVPPVKFINDIEGTDYAKAVSSRMISDVVEKLYEDDRFSVSMNMTGSEMMDSAFVNNFITKIEKSRIDPSRITIEVLESVVNEHDMAYEGIQKFRDAGFQIAIDDFGIGYSNFARIMKLRPDFIKIDGSLVRGIADDTTKMLLLRAVLDMVRVCGARVVAEFVDNERDQKILESLRVDYSQGYLFSKPE